MQALFLTAGLNAAGVIGRQAATSITQSGNKEYSLIFR